MLFEILFRIIGKYISHCWILYSNSHDTTGNSTNNIELIVFASRWGKIPCRLAFRMHFLQFNYIHSYWFACKYSWNHRFIYANILKCEVIRETGTQSNLMQKKKCLKQHCTLALIYVCAAAIAWWTMLNPERKTVPINTQTLNTKWN